MGACICGQWSRSFARPFFKSCFRIFRHESQRSVWMPQCSRFWKRLPQWRSSFFNTKSSVAKVVPKERVFGKKAEQAVRVPVLLVFSSRRKTAHLLLRSSHEFTIFDLISAHRAKKNMRRENFGPDSVKPASCELERRTQDRGVSAKPR